MKLFDKIKKEKIAQIEAEAKLYPNTWSEILNVLKREELVLNVPYGVAFTIIRTEPDYYSSDRAQISLYDFFD